MYNKLFITFILFYYIVSAEKENNQFIATKEWQVIKEGQSIPKGLHVRINLETGLKEAKLLETDHKAEDSHKPSSSNALLELKDQVQTGNSEKIYPPEELKQVMKKIKNDESISEDEIKRIKNKFKNYDELKKDLGDINLTMKTDAELLKTLATNYKYITSNNTFSLEIKNTEILNILHDIEYLVHQIDNANDFVTNGGFNEIIYKNLNNSDVRIKSEVLKILGSCAQNNPKVQIYALETGAVELIPRLLALETNDDVKLQAIYSLSSLLRRFPLAQKLFIKNGGLNIFSNIFKTPNTMKLQLKIVTLLYDLLMEQKEAIYDTEHADYEEKKRQYLLLNLENILIKNGWCEIFNNVLVNNLSIEEVDHDSVERCLNIILLIIDNCREQFNHTKLLSYLEKLKKIYQSLLETDDESESDSSYFSHLKDLTHNLITILHNYKNEL